MAFPSNWEDMTCLIAAGIAAAERDVAMINGQLEELRKLEKERDRKIDYVGVLNGLVDSWRDPDPGKHRDAYFFLDERDNRAVVSEFLPEGAECATKEEWEAYKNEKWWYRYERLPFHYYVVSLAEVSLAVCTKCNCAQPVIEHYVQTRDSPEGDSWLKERLIFCFECNDVFLLNKEVENSRF